jgi:hypothetical protein
VEIVVDPKAPFKAGQFNIVKLSVNQLNFVGYADCFREKLKARSRGMDDVAAEKEFRRARRVKQVVAFDKAGNRVELDQVAFGNMPRQLFVKINNALDVITDKPGKVITEDGDGVNTPIVYQLGTPFEFADTKADQKPIGTQQQIIELEFVAKTGGDIEEVLCHDNALDQTIALLKTCATPLGGGDTGLLRLPSWMIYSLTTSDGFAIMAKVLPVFTE